MKKIYQKPTMHSIVLQHRNQLFSGSPVGRPSATFMSNPTIGDEDNDN